MLQTLNLDSIFEYLYEIQDNGAPYGYARNEDFYTGEGGYYREYKEQFDDLSDGAYYLMEALQNYDVRQNWDDMTVALLGRTHQIVGFDIIEQNYCEMLSWQEEWAENEAVKRIERLSKREMIKCFRRVLAALILFYDIKAAHDCLTSIVEELDERAAMMKNGITPQRSWVE